MPRRTTLYIDIDDTIIAQIMPGSGFDLRPCVMTQLAVLGRTNAKARPQTGIGLKTRSSKKSKQAGIGRGGEVGSLHISVEPEGSWGFLDAVNGLFRRSGKSAASSHSQTRIIS